MNRHSSDLSSTSTPPIETIILDVGAGDGRLVYFLRRAMEEIAKKENRHSKEEQEPNLPIIIATDDGSWKAPIYDNKHIRVEQLSAIEALDKYGPKTGTTTPDQHGVAAKKKTRLIVLCSWMPPGQDWTADFRRPINNVIAAAAKDENGDYDGKEVTSERLVEEYVLIGEADDGTCGHNWHTWGNTDFKTEDAAPRDLNGYERVDLSDLSLLQLSRFDCERSSESVTVSFRHIG
mmetsp:Transcript_23575/g.38270  ORF Transcript_23575/g.38270 Transcript_23575/m.38270 type:complete len:234 (+) Transcript_23575:2-703(+)